VSLQRYNRKGGGGGGGGVGGVGGGEGGVWGVGVVLVMGGCVGGVFGCWRGVFWGVVAGGREGGKTLPASSVLSLLGLCGTRRAPSDCLSQLPLRRPNNPVQHSSGSSRGLLRGKQFLSRRVHSQRKNHTGKSDANSKIKIGALIAPDHKWWRSGSWKRGVPT